jgi:hypothetical protein
VINWLQTPGKCQNKRIMPEVIVEGLQPFEEALKKLDRRYEQILQFSLDLTTLPPQQEAWFLQIMLGLLTDTSFAYQQLKVGLDKSESLLAWAARNLLELNIWAQYVTASCEQAERFYQDWVIDGSELFQSPQDWRVEDGEPPDRVTWALVESMKKPKTDCGLPAMASYLRVGDVASGRLEEEFKQMNRVYSKFVHPTAWSILKMQHHFNLKTMRRLLFTKGATYGFQVSDTLYTHYKSHALNPPPKAATQG